MLEVFTHCADVLSPHPDDCRDEVDESGYMEADGPSHRRFDFEAA